ncbi:MAG: hypothetical protein PVF10_03755, partial [Syntrophobacterales bacterium]|jgi:hypothetical protein
MKNTMNFRYRLKRSIVLFAFLLLVLPALVSQANSSATGPILEIPSPRHDAGTHWEGEVVSHTYQVKNTGDEVLRILSVKPG